MKPIQIIIFILSMLIIMASVALFIHTGNTQKELEVINEAIEFNNKLVESKNKITPKINELDKIFSTVKDKSEASSQLNILRTEIQEELNYVDLIIPEDGGNEFKQSLVNLFEYYIKIIDEYYQKDILRLYYDDINTITLEEFTTKSDEIFNKLNSELTNLIQDFEIKQKEFASKYNLELN